jgi:hypothetical protein
MQSVALDGRRIQPPWSGERAVGLTLVPILVTVLAVWAELSQSHGTSALSFIAGAFYFSSPTVGALAASRTMSAKRAQRLVALIVFTVLAVDWFTQVAQPTQLGLSMGGTGTGNGLIYAIAGATAWYLATRRASWWMNRGHPWAVLAFSAAIVAAGSFAAIFLAVSLPLP